MARSAHRHKRRPATQKPEDVELDIVALGARGDGVARRAGRDVYIAYALPGERVRALVAGERGVISEIVAGSADRAEPSCRHFGDCGGCAVQHAARDYYLGWKRALVVEALARAGLGEAPVRDVVAIAPATRRRATFASARAKAGVALGFNARASHRLVEIAACDILHPALFAALPGLKTLAAAMPVAWRAFDMAATLCENGLDIDITPPRGAGEPGAAAVQRLGEAMRAAGVIRLSLDRAAVLTLAAPVVRFAGAPVTLPPGGFLQASAEGEAAIVSLVESAAAGARKAADLFCGAGALSLPLSKTATVRAVDSDGGATAALAAAARHSPHKPLRAETRNLFERPLMADELADFDVVVFDPPRAGAREQAAEIARSRVPRVIGVSCNPATFARDAALLVAGGYDLVEVTPVDQFVYSAHVELVGTFAKR